MMIFALTLLLLITALAVVYDKYQLRQLFYEIQKAERKLDEYEVEWGRLQLEITMLTAENRVERLATKRLRMVMPLRDEIIYIKP